MAADRVHVELDIERHDGPICGTVRARARVSEFSGWLSLIAELDELRRNDDPVEDEDS